LPPSEPRFRRAEMNQARDQYISWYSRHLTAAVAWLLVSHAGAALPASSLSPSDVQQLSRFDRQPSLRDVPAEARAEMAPRVHASYREVQAVFAGRGPDVARHFLTHTDYPPANEAYSFALEAVADTSTALILINALWDPPKVESGPAISGGGRTWLRERDKAEIHWAIVSVLVNETVRSDPRVVSALLEAIERLRPTRRDLGPGDAGMVVELLGRCTGKEATTALQTLAEDPDAAIRGLAIQGLGHTTVPATPRDPASTLATVARSLRSDPEPRTRVEAAMALGKIGTAEGIPPLRDALESERHPLVVDAIVLALVALKAFPASPELCRTVVPRTWEAHAARFPFACWRASASPEALREAALTGPPQLRALALYALVEKAAEYIHTQPYLMFPPRAVAPPPPPAPGGARALMSLPVQPPAPSPRPRIELDEPLRDRLLTSAVDVMSRPSAGIPDHGSEISSSTVLLVQEALWELADRDMAIALRYADRISTPGARSIMQGRYWASYDLWHKDKAAYLDYRRPRQAAAGALLAAVLAALLAWKRTRRAGALLVTVALTWSLWSLSATQLRELPPPPLQFLTISAIAFLCAGVSVAAMAHLSKSSAPDNLMQAVGRGSTAIGAAAILAFFACGYTRWYDLFPIGGEGWDLIFDPIGSAIIAAVAAAALVLLDRVLFHRLIT